MANHANSKDKVLRLFRDKKVMTLAQLALHLQRCQRTAQRQLKQWQAINSYNKNGRYYVLPDIPSFDADGLWHWRGIFFSKHGNLTQTLVALVRNSKAGLNAAEMEELLGLSPRSFLSSFREHPDLRREKHQGCFVYFSSDLTIYEQQKNQRVTMIRSAKLPSDVEAIAILVETVKNPDLKIEELCTRLKNKKYDITPEVVWNLFAYHGLSVKKTPPSLY
jgi:hypothetical protein